jgi:GNAT superfamily N-acetyltransferase
LDSIVDLNKALALETEDVHLDDANVRRGVKPCLATTDSAPTSAADDDCAVSLSPRFWVAECGGSVVGMIGVSPEWSDWHGTCYWWVVSVFVNSAHRKRGVGRQLFDTVFEIAEQEKVQTVNLRVEKVNDAAQEFYKHIGFVVDDSHLVMSRGKTPAGVAIGGPSGS